MRYYLFIALYMGLIAMGSLLPIGIPHRVITHQDKVMHFFLYLPLGFLLSLPKMPASYYLNYLFPVAIGAVYGVAMELLQSLLPYRTASFGDAAANCLGLFLGLMLGRFWCGRKRSGAPR